MNIVETIVNLEMDKSQTKLQQFLSFCGERFENNDNILKSEIARIDNVFHTTKRWEIENSEQKIKIVYRGGFLETDVIGKSIKLLSFSSSSMDITVANGFKNASKNNKLMICYILPDVKTIQTNKMSYALISEAECLIDRNVYWTLIKKDEPSQEVINSTTNTRSIKKNTIYHVVISTTPLNNKTKLQTVQGQLQPHMDSVDTLINIIRGENSERYLQTDYLDTLHVDTKPYGFDVTQLKKDVILYQGSEFSCINTYLRLQLQNKLKTIYDINNYFTHGFKTNKQNQNYNGIAYTAKSIYGQNKYMVLYENLEDLFTDLTDDDGDNGISFDEDNPFSKPPEKIYDIFILFVDLSTAIRVNHKGKRMLLVVNFDKKLVNKITQVNFELDGKLYSYFLNPYLVYDKMPIEKCDIPNKLSDEIKIKIMNESGDNVIDYYYCKNKHDKQIQQENKINDKIAQIEQDIADDTNKKITAAVIDYFLKKHNKKTKKSTKHNRRSKTQKKKK